MKPVKRKYLLLIPVALVVLVFVLIFARSGKKEEEKTAKPALSVNVEAPLAMRLPIRVSANGNIEAWQEAIISANVGGLILTEVRANVGDIVKKGQVLATFANYIAEADLEQMRAHVAEATAAALDAEANAERAKKVADSGGLSAQQLGQYATAAQTARARLDVQIATVKAQEARLRDTQIVAPDDGVISSRTATLGASTSNQELFRLVRQGRLEWRAEVQAAQLGLLKEGMPATVTAAGGMPIQGKVRAIAPTINPKTRNGIVYVDLSASNSAKAGMFASGEFEVGVSDSLTLPQSAVQVRDGYSYVFLLGANAKVARTKVSTGRRSGERIEILNGLEPTAQVVTAGGGFLSDGDVVRVLPTEKQEPAASAPNSKNGKH
jgi:RND family efflux transporter MFP subunit